MGRSNLRASFVLATSLGLLAGCGTLTNPHVAVDRPAAPANRPALSLNGAIDYADAYKARYKEAIADQTILANSLANGLIPLAGATLGATIAGVSGEVLSYLALSAGTAYTLGNTWHSQPRRQDIWIAGMNGMTCAVEAVMPLAIDIDGLSTQLASLRLDAATVRARAYNAARLRSELETVAGGATPQTRAAVDNLNKADTALAAARTAYGEGVALEQLARNAGEILAQHVSRIDRMVNEQILKTVPDPAALPELIRGLAQTTRTLTGLPGGSAGLIGGLELQPTFTARSATGQDEQVRAFRTLSPLEGLLADELNQMNVALGRLEWSTAHVQAVVKAATESKPSDLLKKCGVEEVAAGLSLLPADGMTLAPGQVEQLLVTGGTPPYRVVPEERSGVTVRAPLAGGGTFTVSAAADAAEGPRRFTVLDSQRGQPRSMSFDVTVKKNSSETAELKPDSPSAAAVKLVGNLKRHCGVRSDFMPFTTAGGEFEVASARASATGVSIVLGARGNHTTRVERGALLTKLLEAASGSELPEDQVRIGNLDAVTSAGSFAPMVCSVQARLAKCEPGPVDGIWGDATRAAFKRYLRGAGLTDMDALDKTTQERILSEDQAVVDGHCVAGARAGDNGTVIDVGDGTPAETGPAACAPGAVASATLQSIANAIRGKTGPLDGLGRFSVDRALVPADNSRVAASVKLIGAPAGTNVNEDTTRARVSGALLAASGVRTDCNPIVASISLAG